MEQFVYDRLRNEWVVRGSIIVAFILGLVARLAFRHLHSGDYTDFLSPWYDVIEEGGFSSLGTQVGDYSLIYQFAIYILTLIPLPKLYSYKILSCMFDIVLAVTCGLISKAISLHMLRDECLSEALGFSLVFLSPTVILNSSAWAQCDSIYSALCMLSILALIHKKNFSAFILLGLSFCFKLQAIFVVPLYVYAAIASKKFSLLSFFAIPLVMIVTAIPFMPLGRSVLDSFNIYANQVTLYPRMALNFPSLWMACVPGTIEESIAMYANGGSLFAIAIAIGAIFIESVALMRYRVQTTVETYIPIAFLFSLTCVTLLPAMHERYAYLVDVLAILTALIDSRFVLPAFALNLASLMTTIRFLFALQFLPDYRLFSVAYVMVSLYTVMTLITMLCNNSLARGADMQEVGH